MTTDASASQPGVLRRSMEYLGFATPRDEAPSQVREAGAGVTPPARPTNETVTAETALGIGAVYRSVSIIVTSVSQMALGVYRNGREIRTPSLIRSPNVNDTTRGFIEETVFSLAAYGNAYWRLYRANAAEEPSNIEVLDPKTVTVNRDPDTGRITYWDGRRFLKAHEIKHLRLMRRPGEPKGLGPIQAANGELTAAVKLRNFADHWFDTSGVPTGTLETDMILSPEESARFAEAWKKFLREHGGVAVLSQGLGYKPTHIKPAEAQFLEVQQAVVVNIARMFGVPAMHLLAELTGTSNTYLNLEQANIVFLQTTLTRYMNEIEDALSDLLPRGQQVQFKEEGLLRLDTVTKWRVLKTQTDIGFTNGAELRAEAGKEPLPAPAQPETDPKAPEEGDDA